MVMAATANRSSSPPVIGKLGRYTVFVTPISTTPTDPAGSSGEVAGPAPQVVVPPPIQPPPLQFDRPGPNSSVSVLRFFRKAVAKVQDVHSSLDDYLADWFGLDQSKYQWALNNYYESGHIGKEAEKTIELADKV